MEPILLSWQGGTHREGNRRALHRFLEGTLAVEPNRPNTTSAHRRTSKRVARDNAAVAR
jgi:hypothetical protein